MTAATKKATKRTVLGDSFDAASMVPIRLHAKGDPERAKTSLALSPTTKFRLSTMKAQLRLAGMLVTEADIVETLITSTPVEQLASEIRGLAAAGARKTKKRP